MHVILILSGLRKVDYISKACLRYIVKPISKIEREKEKKGRKEIRDD